MKESRRNFLKKTASASGFLLIDNVISEEHNETDEEKASYMLNENLTKVGFAESDISPKIGSERPGNYRKQYNKSFHDPCKARVMVIDDGKRISALVGVDALMIPRSLVKSVRKQVEEKCGINPDAILIGASHSHSSGPLGMIQPGDYDHANELVKSLAYEKTVVADPEYLKIVETKIVNSIIQANAIKEESNIGVGIGLENMSGVNRRYHMKSGLIYTYPGRGNPDVIKPAGPIDPEVGVIGVWDRQGKCVGCVVNFARHANCPADGISANWIYYMEQTIKGAMGQQCVVVFLTGACGDISHDDQNDPYASLSSQDKTRFVGGRVGAEVVKVLLSMPRSIISPIDFRIKVLNVNRRFPAKERVYQCYEIVKQDPEKVGNTEWTFAKEIVLLDALLKRQPIAEVEVQAIQVGPAVFISNPAELFCQYGLDLKKHSPFKFTFPVELANGCVGYVPTVTSFGEHGGGYETRLTSYSNLDIHSGDLIVQTGLALAWEMKPGIISEFPEPKPFSGQPWSYGNVKPEIQ